MPDDVKDNPIPPDIRDNPLMLIAWRDCLLWAVGFEPIRTAFIEQTGERLDSLKSTGLEGLIDETTGYRSHVAHSFIKWFNECIWGDMDAKEVTDAR